MNRLKRKGLAGCPRGTPEGLYRASWIGWCLVFSKIGQTSGLVFLARQWVNRSSTRA